mmetsp:Transcript_26725/g.54153  ORF Transcript_26725/g.54153 Transcript_26725/m.54153 type:complete len:176 (+) Transcript_26725:89-616(+)
MAMTSPLAGPGAGALGMDMLLRAMGDSLASGSGQIPDALVAYHLRRACCDLGSDARCARLVAQRAAAYARRLAASTVQAAEAAAASSSSAASLAGGAPPAPAAAGGKGRGKKRQRPQAPEERGAAEAAALAAAKAGEEEVPKVLRTAPLLAAMGVPEPVAAAASRWSGALPATAA